VSRGSINSRACPRIFSYSIIASVSRGESCAMDYQFISCVVGEGGREGERALECVCAAVESIKEGYRHMAGANKHFKNLLPPSPPSLPTSSLPNIRYFPGSLVGVNDEGSLGKYLNPCFSSPRSVII